MINTSRDNLSHIRSKQQREGMSEAQARMGTDLIVAQLTGKVEGDVISSIIMIDQTFYKKNILNLIDYKKNRSEGYIMPIMNSFENNILRVERGMYFKIGGKYYEVKGIPIIDNGIVEAQEVLEDDFNDFPKKYYFTSSEVLSNMVSFQEVQGLIVERLERNKKDKTLNILNIILK